MDSDDFWYAQWGCYYESLKLFREMRLENFRPDEVVLLAALSACVEVGECQFGRSIHGLMVKYGTIVEGFLVNALINLYVKLSKLIKLMQSLSCCLTGVL